MKQPTLLIVALLGLLGLTTAALSPRDSKLPPGASQPNENLVISYAPPATAQTGGSDCECRNVVWGRYCFNGYCEFAPDQQTGCGSNGCPRSRTPPCNPDNCTGCCTQFRY
jgi:hypothetical protein